MDDEVEKAAETTDVVLVGEKSGAIEDADDSNDLEFTDGGDEEEGDGQGGSFEEGLGEEQKKESEPEVKSWKNEKSAENAHRRREADRQAELRKTREQAVIDALGGVNPFTNEKIADSSDVQEYLNMKEIEKSGGDPLSDYSRFLKTRQKEQDRIKAAEDKRSEWIDNDREDFIAKHPDVKLDSLIKDELFKTFAAGKVGSISMTKIYSDYQSFIKLGEQRAEERAKAKAAQILANNDANPGRLSDENPQVQKPISEMTMEEFAAFDEKVKSGKIKLK